MDDLQLIEGLANGHKNAFELLFKKYYSVLVVFAQKMIGDTDTSKELVQDVFVNFYEKRKTIKIHTSLKAHLYQSVRNRCLNHIKRENTIRNHHQTIEVELKDSHVVLDKQIEEVELEQRLFKAIKSLPEKCRVIFEMSRLDGLTNQEIADELELSKRTVETQISKALRIIREKLHDHLLIGVGSTYIISLWLSGVI